MQYQYIPLAAVTHIRVLLLAPAENPDAPLHCSFDQLDPDDPKACYKAISYTWGDQPQDQDLYCERGVIKITWNLSAALRRFRSTSKISRLWADAVCINQTDKAEKSLQIPLMFKIYRSAEGVKIWLGDGAEEYTRAIEAIKLAAKSSKPCVDYSATPSETRNEVQKFFELPWFSRRWVVQELVLNGNPVFYCGQSKVSWAAIHLACTMSPSPWGPTMGVQIHRKIQRLGNLWQAWSYSNVAAEGCDFLTLINDFSDLKCKETKDIIYTFAGLATDLETLAAPRPNPVVNRSRSIVPDYSKSDDEVFQELALEFIKSGVVLRTLALAAACQPKKLGRIFGGWVPDFSYPFSSTMLLSSSDPDFELANEPQIIRGRLQLKIKKPYYATVHELIEPPDTSSHQRFVQSFGPWFEKLARLEAEHRKRQALNKKSVWRHFTRELYDLIYMQQQYEGSPAKHPEYHKWTQTKWREHELKETQWMTQWRMEISRRRFFLRTTFFPSEDSPLLGVGLYDLQVGDAILTPKRPSVSIPLALFLRPVAEGHQLLGDGYIRISDHEPPAMRPSLNRDELEFNLI